MFFTSALREPAVRQDHTADQAAVTVHCQHGGGGVHIHDQQGWGMAAQSTHHGTEQFGAQLSRIVHTDAHAAFQSGTNFHNGGLGHLLQGSRSAR